MSKLYSRAAFYGGGSRARTAKAQPTTLSESGDRSPKGFGYANTGSSNKNIIEQGNKDRFFQAGSDNNQAEAAQARKGFMDQRSSQLVMEQERGHAQSNFLDGQQAKMRLRGEVF